MINNALVSLACVETTAAQLEAPATSTSPRTAAASAGAAAAQSHLQEVLRSRHECTAALPPPLEATALRMLAELQRDAGSLEEARDRCTFRAGSFAVLDRFFGFWKPLQCAALERHKRCPACFDMDPPCCAQPEVGQADTGRGWSGRH